MLEIYYCARLNQHSSGSSNGPQVGLFVSLPGTLRFSRMKWRYSFSAKIAGLADAAKSLWLVAALSLRSRQYDYTTGSIERTVFLLVLPMLLEVFAESVFSIMNILWVSPSDRHRCSDRSGNEPRLCFRSRTVVC
jgi:hypothetical protein